MAEDYLMDHYVLLCDEVGCEAQLDAPHKVEGRLLQTARAYKWTIVGDETFCPEHS